MTSGHLKGALLEFIVRRLMQNCGFTSVRPDGHYVFEQSGLFLINGKGAAHDADTLMEPPIQMPFSYPSRVLFECKSYSYPIGLTVIRNALGLRYDINEFEIVTEDTINKRRNNRRANYAISDRKRYNYQLGVASVELFTRAAFEFAGNNKIPLLSLRWFLSDETCDLFHDINDQYLKKIRARTLVGLYGLFKNKNIDRNNPYNGFDISSFKSRDHIVGKILSDFDEIVRTSCVGLIETGDLLFLFASSEQSTYFLENLSEYSNTKGRLHFYEREKDVWILKIIQQGDLDEGDFYFRVPHRIMMQWSEFSLDKRFAPNIKQRYFSRIFIFTGAQNTNLPFILVNLDQEWLQSVRDRQ